MFVVLFSCVCCTVQPCLLCYSAMFVVLFSRVCCAIQLCLLCYSTLSSAFYFSVLHSSPDFSTTCGIERLVVVGIETKPTSVNFIDEQGMLGACLAVHGRWNVVQAQSLCLFSSRSFFG